MQGIGKSILNKKSLKQFVMARQFLVLLMLVIVIASSIRASCAFRCFGIS